ncbi:uncharacterized protein LOC106065286 [Biomphalaria glabrata]|uniref:Uncharacterized protein LOC106065286 n=1 Tax=Biomphalaria glabrata TaxID=6526 RepID=A0A9W3AB68_BIOGL|nr:uncharacterized protein LOC106065286 [Biomphalaria glabrata]
MVLIVFIFLLTFIYLYAYERGNTQGHAEIKRELITMNDKLYFLIGDMAKIKEKASKLQEDIAEIKEKTSKLEQRMEKDKVFSTSFWDDFGTVIILFFLNMLNCYLNSTSLKLGFINFFNAWFTVMLAQRNSSFVKLATRLPFS